MIAQACERASEQLSEWVCEDVSERATFFLVCEYACVGWKRALGALGACVGRVGCVGCVGCVGRVGYMR